MDSIPTTGMSDGGCGCELPLDRGWRTESIENGWFAPLKVDGWNLKITQLKSGKSSSKTPK